MKRLDNRKGQTLVEFALVLPILLLLLLGLFEFGRIFNATLVLEHAARDVARVGAVKHSKQEIVDAIDERTSVLDSDYLDWKISKDAVDWKSGDDWSALQWTTGDTLTVTLTYDMDLITPMISAIVGDTLSLEGKASMRIE